MTSYSILKTSLLGDLLLVAKPTHLTGIYFGGCDHAPVVRSDWKLDPKHGILVRAAGQLQEYFDGTRTHFSLPLTHEGTDFQQKTWRQIALIPFGETITYAALADRIGAAKAVRAAGTATGRNPLSIVVPCHRVVGKNGTLTGYAGGVERKSRLLELEKNVMQKFPALSSASTASFALSA